MVSGFLELAYMAELSVVFNLAYAELKKDRYLNSSNVIIEKIKTQICNDITPCNISKFQDVALVITQVCNLQSHDWKLRVGAWKVDEEGEPAQHKSFIGSSIFYSFFTNQIDKFIAYSLTVLTTIIIVICTRYNHKEVLAGISSALVWDIFFYFLMFSLIYPLLAILVGRRMKKCLDRISVSIRKSFDTLITKLITDTLHSQPKAN